MKLTPRQLYSPKHTFIWDNLKAISIFAICLAHTPSPECMSWMLPLALPLFSFASGAFFKSPDVLGYCKKVFSLLLLGVIINAPLETILNFERYSTSTFATLFMPPTFLWYIFALLLWAPLASFVKTFKYPFTTSLLFCAVGYFALGSYEFTEWMSGWVFAARMTLRLFPFYLAGNMISWESIVNARLNKWNYLSIVPAAICMASYQFDLLPGRIKPFETPLATLAYMTSAAICVYCFVTCFYGGKIRLITDIGKASLNIYLLHCYVIKAFSAVLLLTIGYKIGLLYIPILVLFCFIIARPYFIKLIFNLLNKTEKMLFAK